MVEKADFSEQQQPANNGAPTPPRSNFCIDNKPIHEHTNEELVAVAKKMGAQCRALEQQHLTTMMRSLEAHVMAALLQYEAERRCLTLFVPAEPGSQARGNHQFTPARLDPRLCAACGAPQKGHP